MTLSKTWQSAVLAALCAVSALPAKATAIFDVATDFSIVGGNPNGAWSYGYSTSLTSALILHAENQTISGVDFWDTNIAVTVPAAFHNATSNVVTLFSTVQLQPGQFALHPGPNNEYAKARLTVQTASDYSIMGAFSGADIQGTTTDAHILLNGVSIFDGMVNGLGPNTGPSFSLTRSLFVGDTLDFAVGFGSNGHYYADSTALSAQITAVPEPETDALMLVGLAGLGLVGFAARNKRNGNLLA
jgi:hypothetical protein